MRIQEYSSVNNNCIYVRTDLYILRHRELGRLWLTRFLISLIHPVEYGKTVSSSANKDSFCFLKVSSVVPFPPA